MILRLQSARLAAFLIAMLPLPIPAVAQVTGILPQNPKPPAPVNPRLLNIDPAAAPMPALKYRLLPSTADLNPGDAAPIYLRIRYQTPETAWNAINVNHAKWRNLPLDQFPAAEARAFVDQFGKQLELTEFGARRRTCDWNYTLPEQRLDQINIDLADAQGMRQWLRLLDIKARAEIAERKYDRALRTIETGMALSRHVAEGTFLINGLIGLAGGVTLLDRCEELIAQPGATNLYWALTVLPRPLIDLRHAVENEQKLCENLIPELAEALSGEDRTADEWALLLSRMHQGIAKWCRFFGGAGGFSDARLKAVATWDLARLKAETLPAAREYLKSAGGRADRSLAEMSDDQVVALYLAGRYRELWDDHFKASYLPPRAARPVFAAAEKRLAAAKDGPITLFVGVVPALQAAMMGALRADRQVAALRVIEALRLYAAAHDGQLPESLDQIKEVPVPEDPATGEPFIYRAADSAAILHGPRADLPYPPPSYRITVRR